MSSKNVVAASICIILLCIVATSCSDSARPVGIAEKPIAVNGVQVIDSERPPRKPLPEMTWTNFDGVVEKVKDHEGKVVPRKELLEKVWGLTRAPATRTVDTFMLALRKYFEADPSKPIHFLSVRGTGYRFVREPG
jgi:hypothetical protein